MPAIKGRFWIATLPIAHYPNQPTLSDGIMWMRGQREQGAGGLEHWQFCIAFNSCDTTLAQAKSYFVPQIHLEKTRSVAAHDYVWKDETAVPGTRFEVGQLPLRRNNKRDWDTILANAKNGEFDEIPSDVYVQHYSKIRRIAVDNSINIWRGPITANIYWGQSGTGKSRRAWFEGGHDAYIKDPCTKWWDGYKGQETVIIDEFTGLIKIEHVLRWLDRYPCNVEIKGATVPLRATKFFLTSNKDPNDWFPEASQDQVAALRRRCNITHFLNAWTPPVLPDPNPNPNNANIDLAWIEDIFNE